MSKTLVRLKIGVRGGIIVVEDDVSLPKLKTPHLDYLSINDSMFAKLLSGCHELEELVLNKSMLDLREPFSVSITSLKRLKFYSSKDFYDRSESISFDTPNLVYLEYSDAIAVKYPQVCFDSLVEASVGLRLTGDQIERIRYAEDVEAVTDGEMIIGDVSNFLMGICNVKILYLSDKTLEVSSHLSSNLFYCYSEK